MCKLTLCAVLVGVFSLMSLSGFSGMEGREREEEFAPLLCIMHGAYSLMVVGEFVKLTVTAGTCDTTTEVELSLVV